MDFTNPSLGLGLPGSLQGIPAPKTSPVPGIAGVFEEVREGNAAGVLWGKHSTISMGLMWGSGTPAWRNPLHIAWGTDRDVAELFGHGYLGTRFCGYWLFRAPGFLGSTFSAYQVLCVPGFQGFTFRAAGTPGLSITQRWVAEGQDMCLHSGANATCAAQGSTSGFIFCAVKWRVYPKGACKDKLELAKQGSCLVLAGEDPCVFLPSAIPSSCTS